MAFRTPAAQTRRIEAMRKLCTVTVTPIAGGWRVLTKHNKRRREEAESDHESTLPLAEFLACEEYAANVRDHLTLIDADLNG
jgi:hypothetical protein